MNEKIFSDDFDIDFSTVQSVNDVNDQEINGLFGGSNSPPNLRPLSPDINEFFSKFSSHSEQCLDFFMGFTSQTTSFYNDFSNPSRNKNSQITFPSSHDDEILPSYVHNLSRISSSYDYNPQQTSLPVQSPLPTANRDNSHSRSSSRENFHRSIQLIDDQREEFKINSRIRADFTKNYTETVCYTFSLKIKNCIPELETILQSLLSQYPNINDLENKVRAYISVNLEGKVPGIETNRSLYGSVKPSRQYKIQGKKDVQVVFHECEGDSSELVAIKTIVKKLIVAFLGLNVYRQWAETEFGTEDPDLKACYLRSQYIEEMVKAFEKPFEKRRFK